MASLRCAIHCWLRRLHVGKVIKIQPVKLITGLITQNVNSFVKAHRALGKQFGSVDYKSPILDFKLTDYYRDEMGTDLKRQFISFHKLIDPARLPDIKLFTNKLEDKFSKNSKRLINIDPGYVTAAKLVLVTTKNFAHRIYLNKGIFAEITLKFKNSSFRPHELTFPDYRTEEYITIFNHIREIYMNR